MATERRLAALFYEIRAKTEGLQQDLNAAEKQFGKLSEFVKANPTAAIAALGVAIAGVALQATKMASEVETALRRVGNSIPNGVAGLDTLRAGIESVARDTGRAQADIARDLATIARQGVEGPEEAIQRLKAVQTAADATGEDINGIIEGLDQTLDLFGGSSEDAARALGSLFAAAKGRSSLTDLFAALQAAAPAVSKLKLDLDTTARALAALGDQGKSPKQAATELKALAEQGEAGRRVIVQLAESIPATTDGFTELTKAANDFNNSAEQLNKRALNDFQSAMIDLGRAILPTVSAELRDLIDIIELFTGAKAKRLKELGVTDLGAKFSESIRANADVLELQARGIRSAAKDLDKALASGSTELIATTTEGLRAVAVGLDHLVDIGILKADEVAAARKRLDDATRQAGSGAPLRATATTTADDIKEQQKAAKDAQEEIEKLAERLSRLGSVQSQTTGQTHLSATAYADFAAEIAKASAKFPQFSGDLEAMSRQLFSLRQAASQFEAAELAREIETLLASFTTTTVDDLEISLKKLQQTLRQKGATEEQIAQITKLEEAFIEVKKSSDELDAALEQGRRGGITPLKEMVRLLQQLAAAEEKLKALESAGPEHDRERKELLEQIAKLQARIKELQEQTEESTKKTTTATSSFRDKLNDALKLAFGLASALGGADDTLVRMIGSASQIADGLASISKLAKDVGGFAKLFSSGKGIVSALPGIGQIIGGGIAIASLLDDPDARANREATQKNTVALRQLEKSLGDLARIQLSGRTTSAVQSAISTIDLKGVSSNVEAFKRFTAAIRSSGLAIEDVMELAKSLGFDLTRFTAAGLKAFQKGLKELDFKAFADTFAGQLSALEQRFRLFDVNEPSAQFDALIDLLTDPVRGAPALFGALDGIDTKTKEGRDKAKEQIRKIFDAIVAGAIDPDQLGGLNLDQLRDVLDRLFGLLGDGVDTVTSLLEKLNEAFATIDEDLEIAGISDPLQRAIRRAAAAIANDPRIASALGGLDLANAEQRQQAIKALQGLAEGADKELRQIILELLRSIRDIPATTGRPGEVEIVANAAKGLTETTGNRMADYLATANIILREQLEVLAQIRDFIGPQVPTSLISAPSFSGALGASALVSGPTITVTVGDIVVQATGDLSAPGAAQSLAAQLSPALIRQISEGLARQARGDARAGGVILS